MSYNPLLWKSFDISDKPHQQLFMGQLTDLLNFLNSAQGLATLLNGQGLLGSSATTYQQINVNLVSTQTFSLANAAGVYLIGIVNSAITPIINLTNLNAGSQVQMRITNNTGGTIVFFVNASNTSGVAYFVAAGGTGFLSRIDSIGAGLNLLSGQSAMMIGNVIGADLEFVTVIP